MEQTSAGSIAICFEGSECHVTAIHWKPVSKAATGKLQQAGTVHQVPACTSTPAETKTAPIEAVVTEENVVNLVTLPLGIGQM